MELNYQCFQKVKDSLNIGYLATFGKGITSEEGIKIQCNLYDTFCAIYQYIQNRKYAQATAEFILMTQSILDKCSYLIPENKEDIVYHRHSPADIAESAALFNAFNKCIGYLCTYIPEDKLKQYYFDT